MNRKLLFIRTYIPAGTGGPLPPVELLSLAAFLLRDDTAKADIKIIDTGLLPAPIIDAVREILASFAPDIVCCSSLPWEAGLVHAIAAIARNQARPPMFLVHGQLPALLGEDLLGDVCIDAAIIGDGEEILRDIIAGSITATELARVDGLLCRQAGVSRLTRAREPLHNLDDTIISPEAWALVDIYAYSRQQGWNGSLTEKIYLPIVTSRGCPFGCTYCNIPATVGKTFRTRTPESVVAELSSLHRAFGVREFHIFDAAFNANPDRAAEICRQIIAAGLPITLAFPHGLRADCMTEELIALLRKAGTYKIVYGIETASPRLQTMIGKNLNLTQTRRVISVTAREGIITGGYFMLGLPTETIDEMRQTIAYAVDSELEVASFFKMLDYTEFRRAYRAWGDARTDQKYDPTAFSALTYFSRDRGSDTVPTATLNALLAEAQRAFYFHPRRLWRLWRKSHSKLHFLNNLFSAAVTMFAAYLLVAGSRSSAKNTIAPGSKKKRFKGLH
ncbi:MAG: radical SAM protein [Elusimicrobia bacterium]|nr:radical SAM protein [Elusimicrobiota bacterium]